MALYAIADLHLSEDCDKPMDIFGAAWTDHKNRLEEYWRATVTEEDTVVIPGDISWGIRFDNTEKDLLFINSLPGKKIIGKGNHDYWWNTLTKLNAFCADIGADSISFLYNNAYKVGDKIVCGTRGWFPEHTYGPDDEKIAQREAGRLRRSLEAGLAMADGEEIVVFLHYPPAYGALTCRPVAEVLWEYSVKRCFYGHLHNAPARLLERSCGKTDLTLIAADALRFVPLRID